MANHSTETIAKWEDATFVTVVQLQLEGNTFEFLTAITLFMSIIKTMVLDSVFHHLKLHHLFVAEQINENKNFFSLILQG